MANQRIFDLNVFDEQVDVPPRPVQERMEITPFISVTLTKQQRAILDSSYLRKISAAHKKWQQVCHEKKEGLADLFKKRKEPEFQGKYNSFEAGKFWQMMGYLDGNHLLEGKSANPAEARKRYQDDLMQHSLVAGDLLQAGWDLAINSALLCDLMPAPMNDGGIYLFERVVNDKNSLFYPSVTNEFHARVVNEAFWQSLFDSHQLHHVDVLEEILMNQSEKLAPKYANDFFLRWKNSKNNSMVVSPTLVRGSEEFYGLSAGAVENLGDFLNQTYLGYNRDKKDLTPFIQAYVESVNASDQDGIEFFGELDKKRLLSLQVVEELDIKVAE